MLEVAVVLICPRCEALSARIDTPIPIGSPSHASSDVIPLRIHPDGQYSPLAPLAAPT